MIIKSLSLNLKGKIKTYFCENPKIYQFVFP